MQVIHVFSEQQTRNGAFVIIGFSASIAFLYNVSTYYLTLFTSALTINIFANLKQARLPALVHAHREEDECALASRSSSSSPQPSSWTTCTAT